MTGQLFRDYVKEHGLDLEGAQEQNTKLTKAVDNKVKGMLHGPGNLIVDGWMSGLSANHLEDVLKVLLVCKDDIRYKRFAKREKIKLFDARLRVEDRQNSWFDKIEKIHKIKRKEFIDEKNYTLVIDTSYITPQAVLKRVLLALNQ